MKYLIFLNVIYLTLVNMNGQDAQTTRKNTAMGGGGFTIGYGQMDVSKLQIFVPAGMGEIGKDHIVIGGTGHAMINNFVIGGSGCGIVGNTLRSDTMSASAGGGMGTFDMGYLVMNRKHVKIFPLLGIGMQGYGIHISNTNTISAGKVAKNPAQEISINKGGFSADISININFIPRLEYKEEEKSYGGFMTGLRIGYVFSLPSSDWRYTGGYINGGPRFGLNMWYVKLVLGGFGFQEK